MDSCKNGFTTKNIPFGLDVQGHVPDSYNCKVKLYPDGTENMCIHQNDVFGGDPYSSTRSYIIISFLFPSFRFHSLHKKRSELVYKSIHAPRGGERSACLLLLL